MFISRVGGVIAAASQKASKPNLQLGSITVVKRIVLTMQQAGVFPIVVITGVEADAVKYQLAGRGIVFLHNEAFQEPELMDSVLIGLAFLQDRCKRVVFTPVNVPLFSPATLQRLLATPGEIVTPSYQHRGGHPVVLSQEVLPAILGYRGNDGLRGAIASLAAQRTWLDVADEGVTLTIHREPELKAYLESHRNAFLHPHVQLRLEGEEELLGTRARLLLVLIGITHSVRAASEMMALSGSKAWNILNKLEAALGYPLITRRQGGQQGSRSDLTEKGLAFLAAFQQYEDQVIAYSNDQFDVLLRASGLLRP